MSLMQAVLIFIGLSLDSFIVMMNKGASIRTLKIKHLLSYALIYSLVDVGAVLIGYGISYLFKDAMIDRLEVAIACLIMFVIGCYLCTKSFRADPFVEKLDDNFGLKQCFLTALATSLDTLFLGVGFSFLEISMLQAVLLSFIITFVTIVVALKIGYTQGAQYQRVVGMSGGGLILVFSLYILTVYVLMR